MEQATHVGEQIVALPRVSGRPVIATGALLSTLVAAIAVAIFAARAVPAWHQPVTSDESLYLSEGVSMAHGHLTYSSGAVVVHRPPLFPATIAPLMKLTHNNLTVVRIMPVLYAAGALGALFLLGRTLFGSLVAAIAVVLAAAASYPARLSTEFFVDTPESAFLLAAVAALFYAQREEDGALRWSLVGGLLLGTAFLMKETAVFWLPLPILVSLFNGVTTRRLFAIRIASWLAGFALLAAPWFGWVAWHTGAMYKLSGSALAELGLASAVAVVVASVVWTRAPGRSRCVLLASVLLTAWCAASLRVLELRPEPQAVEYAHTVPHWLVHVFGTSVEPSSLIALAWAWVFYRAVRGETGARAIGITAALCVPLLLFVANRGWEPREVMPLVYLSYLALAAASVELGTALASDWTPRKRQLAGTALVVSLACVAGFVSALNPTVATEDPGSNAILNWSGTEERATSAMLDGVPPGAVVLSSRLYYSQIYVDHDARFAVVQLPTLGVRFQPGSDRVQPFGTVFRYEESPVPLDTRRHWIYLRQHATRDYAIGLASEDLYSTITQQRVDFVLLSGDDAGFSAVSYVPYFEANPAFTLLRQSIGPTVNSYLFAVDRAKLALQPGPIALDMRDLRYIDASLTDGAAGEERFWNELAPNGIVLNGNAVISAATASELVRDSRAMVSP